MYGLHSLNGSLSAPWNVLRDFEEQVSRLLGDETSYSDDSFPWLNVWLRSEDAMITAEIPGIDPQTIDISVNNKQITLKGTRPAPELKDGEKFLRRERHQGEFSRTLELPFTIASDLVEAEYRNGVLAIKAPRISSEQPRKITVKS